jgi:zinc protease
MLFSARLRLPAIVFALAATAFPQTLPNGVQKVTSVEGITEYSLPDGLRVLLFPDPSKPKVTLNMTYLVGSRLEGYGETGMAHLLEHLMFKATKTRKDLKQELTDHGTVWNGTTSYDRTNYFETFTATEENLRWAIGFEADRMVNARIEKPLLDTEMTVVRNEFEMGENSPARILQQRTLEAAYSWHNYGKETIGARSDIEHVPIDRLAAFYQKYYQPDDAILIVAGQFDEAKTLGWIADAFRGVPRPQRKLEQTYTVEPTQDGERTVALRRVGDNQEVMAVYHGPAGSHPDSAALDVLSSVLGDAPSGRLYKALVDNKKAVGVRMGFESLHDPGFIMVAAQLRKEQSLDDAQRALLDAVEGLSKDPPTKDEVERAKTRILKQIDLALTNSQAIALQLSEWASMGDWRLFFLNRDRTKEVTEQDVLRVAKTYFKESNRTIGVFIPTPSPDRAEIPQVADARDFVTNYTGGAAIAQGEAFDPTPANIESRLQRSKLPSGMKLSLLPKRTRGGTVEALVALHFGDEKSLAGKSAVAQITSGLLMRGTKTKTRQQIQDEFDRLKAQVMIAPMSGVGSVTVTIQTVEENLPGTLRLVAEILRDPSFPEGDFEQIRQQRLARVEAGKSEPQTLAMLELNRHLNPYARGDARYVSTPDEEIEDLKKVALDDVRQFHQQFYGASEAEFVVAGQFEPAAIQKLADELFGDWKSAAPYQRITRAYQSVAAINDKIETPDKQNTDFVAGMHLKMSDDDPDYPAMILANYIFGGSPGARLFNRIRDKEGLSYGVSSQFTAEYKQDSAVFAARAISAPQNTPKVEASFKDELARTLRDGFNAEEVAAAKKALLEEQLVRRSQDQTLVRSLATLDHDGRSMQWDAQLEAKIAALNAEQVSLAFRRHVDPSALSIVKAGDFKKAGVFQN